MENPHGPLRLAQSWLWATFWQQSPPERPCLLKECLGQSSPFCPCPCSVWQKRQLRHLPWDLVQPGHLLIQRFLCRQLLALLPFLLWLLQLLLIKSPQRPPEPTPDANPKHR